MIRFQLTYLKCLVLLKGMISDFTMIIQQTPEPDGSK